MIIYAEQLRTFKEDLMDSTIDEKLQASILEQMGRSTALNEIRSWRNSITQVGMVLSSSGIPDDSGIALEYNIPYTSKRIDMIVSGLDDEEKNTAIIIELKQWDSASRTGKDGIVSTFINGSVREVAHPSYQAWSYAMAIRDFNASVQDHDIILHPCTYLHNYASFQGDPIVCGEEYIEYIRSAPVFTKHDNRDLIEFIRKYIRKGDALETVFYIDRGKLRPSKSLQDCLASMLRGNREFTLLDTQKVVYEDIMQAARRIKNGAGKNVIIVRGGPGTGKSVLAVNLLNSITSEGMATAYVSKNAAPRHVYSAKLKGSMAKSRVDNMFKGSGSFTSCPEDAFDVLLADEAHRLNGKSGLYSNLGENQIKEIIRSSKLSVFFIDEDQRVTLKDIGTVDEIKRHAEAASATITEMELDSQFRCSGSDGYLQWIDNVLGIRETATYDLTGTSYDFRVFDDPNDLRDAIVGLNGNNRSRLVAGYCWNWISEGKNDSSVHDITIPEYGFEMSWNLGSSETWAIDRDSVNEIGCIHTCQGLEFDYVGVIIGPDMFCRDGEVLTDYRKRAKTDQSLKGIGKLPENEASEIADRIIRNTYKVLMTRGMKGCFIYCVDDELCNHFTDSIRSCRFDAARTQYSPGPQSKGFFPLRRLKKTALRTLVSFNK